MKRYRLPIILILLVIMIGLLVTSATANRPPMVPENAIWQIKDSEVISPGTVVELDEGTLISGYTLAAKAKTKSGKLPDGVFEMTVDAFRPNQDMPGQIAGWWYIQGTWTITRNGAVKAAKNVHSPDMLSGQIHAGLPTNPLTEAQNWSAGITVPMATLMGQWGRGEGSLTLNSGAEGDLYLDLTMGPQGQ